MISIEQLTKDEKAVLTLIQRGVAVSKEQIAERSELKSTTLNRIFETLKEGGLIQVCGYGGSSGGRRPILYGIHPDVEMYFLGINIVPMYSNICLMDFSNNIIFDQRVTLEGDIAPEDAADRILAVLDMQLQQRKIPRDRIVCGGIGTFCRIDRAAGVIHAIDLGGYGNPAWEGFSVAEAFEKRMGIGFFLDTTSNASCIGEYIHGCGKGKEQIAVLLCGYATIHLGQIAHNRVLRPRNDGNDAFGHMTIVAGGKKCSCGNYGCTDSYATGTAIREAFADELRFGRKSILEKLNPEEVTLEQIIDAGEKGDALSIEVLSKAGFYLGVAVANYINLFAPDVLAFGGMLVEQSNVYTEAFQAAAMKKLSLFAPDFSHRFVPRSIWGKSVVGCAVMAKEKFLGNEF